MKKTTQTILFLAASLAALSPAQARKSMGDNLSDMIIQGENRLQAHPKIDDVAWTVNVYRDIPDVVRDNSWMSQFQPPAISQPPVVFPKQSASDKTSSPWMTRIYEPPVLTLQFKAENVSAKGEWTFLVKDSQGKTFYELKKKDKVPGELAWDGVGNGGQTLRVGYDYSYSFSFMDEAGNPQRFAGKSFRLDAFRHRKTTSFQPEVIFESRASTKFSREGKDYLTEMKDFIRTRFGKPITVRSYDVDKGFALSRSKAVRDFLSAALDIPEEKITVDGQPVKDGKDYRHVDIIVE